jgi:Sucrase/ferredoxin-like
VTALAERCSTLARTLAEPLAGTAPLARTWVALEQPGPWGHRALTESHLDPELGAELTARQEGAGVTVVLVRRPGHHADPESAPLHHPADPTAPRALWIGHTGREPWLLRATLSDPAALLGLDFAALGAGVPPALGEADTEPLLLVCTNSRRDECCALIGRPLALELSAACPGRVWESSHLGGHRLGPVVLSLPDGFVFGGPDAGSRQLSSCRGRSTLSRPAQAAELAALTASSDPGPRALSVEADGDDWLVLDPSAADSKPVRYAVSAHVQDPARKESCRKGPVSSVTYVAVRIGQ